MQWVLPGQCKLKQMKWIPPYSYSSFSCAVLLQSFFFFLSSEKKLDWSCEAPYFPHVIFISSGLFWKCSLSAWFLPPKPCKLWDCCSLSLFAPYQKQPKCDHDLYLPNLGYSVTESGIQMKEKCLNKPCFLLTGSVLCPILGLLGVCGPWDWLWLRSVILGLPFWCHCCSGRTSKHASLLEQWFLSCAAFLEAGCCWGWFAEAVEQMSSQLTSVVPWVVLAGTGCWGCGKLDGHHSNWEELWTFPC